MEDRESLEHSDINGHIDAIRSVLRELANWQGECREADSGRAPGDFAPIIKNDSDGAPAPLWLAVVDLQRHYRPKPILPRSMRRPWREMTPETDEDAHSDEAAEEVIAAAEEFAIELRNELSRLEEIAKKNAVPPTVDEDRFEATRDALSGVLLKLFQHLHGKSQYTYFEELQHSGVFTKSDMTRKGIETAITRLSKALEEIQAPYFVEFSTADRRVKLASKSPSN